MSEIAVIGPGRAGTAVALAAARAGHDVVAVAGRGQAAVDRFVALLPTARPVSSEEAARAADLVVVAVPDGAVADVQRAVAVADAVGVGSRWVHLAGSLGVEALRHVRLAGARVAACHPAQTLADPETGAAALDGCAWAVTAPAGERSWAHALVRDLGGVPADVAEEDRVLYHAAMTLAANATTSVVTVARELLLGVRVAEPERFLEPLATAAVQGAARRGAGALTGPVRRGDAGTVAAHLEELSTALPGTVDAYRALAALGLAQSRRAGLDAAAAAEVAAVLAAAPTAPGRRHGRGDD